MNENTPQQFDGKKFPSYILLVILITLLVFGTANIEDITSAPN